MANHTFRVHKFVQQNPLPLEQCNDHHSCASTTTEAINVNVHEYPTAETTTPTLPWRLNTRLHKLHTKFQNIILYQHICVPCVYCARLLYPEKAKWIFYNKNQTYPLQTHFPEVDLIFSGDAENPKVAFVPVVKLNLENIYAHVYMKYPQKLNAF